MDSFLGNISGYWWRGAEGAGGEEQLKILRFLSSRKVQKEWPGGREGGEMILSFKSKLLRFKILSSKVKGGQEGGAEGGEMILSFKFKFRDLKCMSSKVWGEQGGGRREGGEQWRPSRRQLRPAVTAEQLLTCFPTFLPHLPSYPIIFKT